VILNVDNVHVNIALKANTSKLEKLHTVNYLLMLIDICEIKEGALIFFVSYYLIAAEKTTLVNSRRQ